MEEKVKAKLKEIALKYKDRFNELQKSYQEQRKIEVEMVRLQGEHRALNDLLPEKDKEAKMEDVA